MKVRRYLAAVVFMVMASPVLACTCNFGKPETGFARAQAVFTGKVIRSSKSKWTIEVDKVWKGEVESQIELFDAHAGSSCATRGFKKGRSYLLLVNVETRNGKTRYSPQVCNWSIALKTVKLTIEEGVMTPGEGVDARWVEDLVLMGQGEGKPPLTRSQ